MALSDRLGAVPSETDARESREDLSVADAIRRLRALRHYEAIYAPLEGYIEHVQRQGMTVEWRSKIVTWYHQLADSFALDVTTIYAATNFLDRFLSKKSCNSMNFRLASIGCLFLAAKIEERTPILATHFCELSEGLFTPTDLRLMELELLRTLRWRLYPTTPLTFAGLLARLYDGAPDEIDTIEQRTTALLSVTLFEVELLAYPASMQAVAAMICAMKELGLGSGDVRRWLARVDACDFAYRTAERAGDAMRDLGARLYAHVLRDADADREVELAMHDPHCETPPPPPPSQHHLHARADAELAEVPNDDRDHAPSPDGVAEIAAAIEEAVHLRATNPPKSGGATGCAASYAAASEDGAVSWRDRGDTAAPPSEDDDESLAAVRTRRRRRRGADDDDDENTAAAGPAPGPVDDDDDGGDRGVGLSTTTTTTTTSKNPLERQSSVASEATVVADLDDPRLRSSEDSPRSWTSSKPPARRVAGTGDPDPARDRGVSIDSSHTAGGGTTASGGDAPSSRAAQRSFAAPRRRDDRKRSRWVAAG